MNLLCIFKVHTFFSLQKELSGYILKITNTGEDVSR